MKHIILFLLTLFTVLTLSAQQTPDCQAPENLSLSNLTSTGVTLNWGLSAGHDAPSIYTLTLKDRNRVTIFQDNAVSAPLLTHNITGLTPNTTYIAELTGNCNASSSGYSTTASITFTTLCGPIAAPYTQDFDTLTSLPGCTFSMGASISYVGRYGKSVALHTTSTTSAYLVFPELSLTSNLVECSLFLKASSVYEGNIPYQIGLITDPADVGSSFEPLCFGSLSDLNWKEIQMNTSSTLQPILSTAMIAVNIPAGFDVDVYVDDVSIHQVPTCIRPEDFTVSDILSTSATVQWTTTNAANSRIYISSNEGNTSILASSNPFTLTGLTPNTEYTLTLRGICSPTDSSELCRQTLRFTTRCDIAPSPLFHETFDTLTLPNTVPVCWETGWLYRHRDVTVDTPFSSTVSQVHSGARAMMLLPQPTGSTSYLSSQLLPIDAAGSYTLSVWVYRQNVSQYQTEALRFWASPSYNSTSGATLLGTVHLHYQSAPAEPTANLWYNYEYVIPATGSLYILVEGISETGASIYFDDLEVKPTPSCLKVSDIRLSAPSSSSVDLLWTPGNTESSWAVDYILTQNASIVASSSDTVSSPSLTLSSLTPATVYSLTGSVHALCSAQDTSVAVPFSHTFTTACLPLSSLPYTCGFESTELSVASNPLPLCWQRLNDAQLSNSFYPGASASADLARNGSGFLRFFPSSSVLYDYGSYQMAILPEIDPSYPLNTLRVTFYSRAQEASTVHTLLVGVISDPDDVSTFTVIDSFPVYGNTYRRHEVLFDTCSLSGRMALMVRRADHGQPVILIDDLTIDPIPSCRDIADENIVVSDINDVSALLSMTDATVTSWQYAVALAGAPLSSLTPVTPTSATLTVTGLIPSTSYSLYARRICGAEHGLWSDAVNFTTSSPAASIPYSEDFENISVGTIRNSLFVEAGNLGDSLSVFNSVTGAVANQTYNHTTGGSHGLATSDGISLTSVTSYMKAAAYVHLEAGRNYEVSLYAKKYAASYPDYSYSLSFIVGFSTSSLSPVGTHIVSTDAFTRYASSFSVPATGNYYVGFSSSANVGNTDYYLFVDDIRIDELACSAPSSVVVSDLSANSATLGIVSTASAWQVAVSSFPIDIEASFSADIMNDTVTSPIVNLSGLRSNADYYYTIRSICANGEISAWLAPASFHTRCANEEIPYTEGFEQIGSTRCWTTFGGTGSVSRSTSQSHSGNASMLASSVTVISPQMNVITFAPYQLSAWVKTSGSNSILSIGVMNDPDDATSFENLYVGTVPGNGRWNEVIVPFSLLNDPEYQEFYNARYILIAISGDSAVYFDDIHIDLPPTCAKPSAPTISSITSTSAVVDWTEPGDASQWRIRLVHASGTQNSVNVTSHPYTLTGLNPSSPYTLYITSLCSAADESEELCVGQFTTACGTVTAPYSEDFELQTLRTTPACWNNNGLNQERVWGVHQSGNNRSIRMWNGGVQSVAATIASPEIYLPSGTIYELAYDYSHQSTSGPLEVKVRRRGETSYTTLASHSNTGESTTEDNTPVAFHSNIIPLTAYSGDTIQVQFYNYADDIFGDGALFVDNVKVRVYNPCTTPSLSLASLSDDAASFRITDTLHTSWQYAYGLRGFNVATAQPLTASSNTINVAGLSPFTFYDLCVRSVCGSGSYSEWQRISFQTTEAATPLPYSTDFSDPADNALWLADGDAANAFTFGTDAAALINSSHALYVSSDGIHYDYDVSVNSMSCISRLFEFGEGNYNIEFDWQCPGGKYVLNGVADYGRFYLMPAYASPLPQGTGMYYRYYFWDNGIIPLDGDTCLQLISGRHHLSADIDFTGRAGAYRLVFFWFTENDGGQSHYPLSVCNLSLRSANCASVTNLVVPAETVTQTSASVHCDLSAPLLRYVVSTSALISDSILTGTSASGDFSLTALLPSTEYHLFVRAECSASDVSSWSDVIFSTLCGAVTSYPYFQDFEGTLFPPYCWTASGWSRYNNRPYQYAHGNGCAHAGFNTDQPLISPELRFEADRQYYLSFWLLRSNMTYHNDQLKIYISPSTSLSDATLLASYVTYDFSATGQALCFYSIDLPEALSGSYYIIFSATGMTSNQTIYLDDVTFGVYPLCRRMTAAPVATARTTTTATLSSQTNNYTSVQYGFAPYSATATPSSITDVYDTCFVTGLTPNTSYSVFARGICSFADDTTDWSPALKLTTRISDCFAPDGLSFVTQTSDTMASVRWNTVPDVSLYQVILSSAAGSDTLLTTATSHVFAPLTANTSYSLAIRGFCSGTDTTDWNTLTFTTLRTPASIPYHTGFEPTDDNALWHVVASSFSNFAIGTDGGGRHSGTQGLYVSSDGSTYSQTLPTAPGTGNVYGSAYITRTVHFDQPGNYEVSFDWKSDPVSDNTYGYFDAYGRAFIAPVDASLIIDAGNYATALPDGSIALASSLTGSQTWQRSSFIVNVPEAGFRDIVFQWYSYNKYSSADQTDLSDYPLAVDNLDISRIYCLSVDDISMVTYSDSFAVVHVSRSESALLEYALLTVNNEDSISSVTSIDADTIRLSGLAPLTTYYLFVRQVCSPEHSSSWRSLSFRTTTAPASLPYICDFENTAENNLWLFAQSQQNAFVIGSNAYGDNTRALYISSDGASNTYHNTIESYAFATRALYLTPGDYYLSYDWRNDGESNHDYGRFFLLPADRVMPVGTYLPDLGTTVLPYSAIALDGGSQLVSNPSVASFETTFRIAAEGSYNLIAAWQNDHQDGANPPLLLDNINLRETSCFPPAVSVVNDLQVPDLSSVVFSSSQVGMDILYAVSTTTSLADAVLIDTLRSFSGRDTILLSSLSSASSYYLLCRSLCSADDYSVLSATPFSTPCGIISSFPYRQGFESVSTTYIPDMISSLCWTAYGASSATAGNPRYQATTDASCVTTGSRALQISSHRTNPLTLVLPAMTDISPLRLTFDVRYASTKNMPLLTAGYLTDPADASSFVAVTTTAASTSFTSYTVTFTAAPAGSSIAFQCVGGNTNGKLIYLDNVSVLHVVDGDTYSDTVCYGEGYHSHGFSISADSIPVGSSTHYRTVHATIASDPDTLFTLTILKRSEALQTYRDTICGGSPYISGIWNIPYPETRRYHQLFPGASRFGCDSTVELFLVVIPTSTLIWDTICHGQSYRFGTQTLTTSGRYIRTYQTTHGCTATDTLFLTVVTDSVFSSGTLCQADLPYHWKGGEYYYTGRYFKTVTGPHGCPQTAVLDLTVLAADTTLNVPLCTGGSVLVLDTVITAPGIYTLRRLNFLGCDVLYHINVTDAPIVPEEVYDVACEGKPYYGHGIFDLVITSDTVVTISTRSLDNRCDSVAHVNLSLHPTQYSDTNAYMNPGGNFTWHSQTYTTPGEYRDTLQDVDGCDSIVTLHLALGVDDVFEVSVTIIPNPVTAGATALIYGDYGDVRTVEIFDSYGNLVESFTPDTHPIGITAPSASGIYCIRLTASDGTIHIRKMIVK